VETASREQLVKRLTAVVEDALDCVERDCPKGFDVGVVGLVFEVLVEGEPDPHLRRSDAGYTPGDDVSSYFQTYCTDHRRWVKQKVFEEAYDLHLYGDTGASEDDDGDSDEG
jgi:hypothetical protein